MGVVESVEVEVVEAERGGEGGDEGMSISFGERGGVVSGRIELDAIDT